MEEALGEAYSEPVADVRGFVAQMRGLAGRLDAGTHLARDRLDLPALVAQRPQVDALASRRGVLREESRAVRSRADAEPASQLVRISVQDRCEDIAEDSIPIDAILGDPGPHRGESVRKALRVPPTVFELARELLPCFREAERRRVVGGGEPAVTGARDPT